MLYAVGAMHAKPTDDHMGSSWEDDVDTLYEFFRVRGMSSQWELSQMSNTNSITGSEFGQRANPVDKVIDAMHDWSTWVDERLYMRRWN